MRGIPGFISRRSFASARTSRRPWVALGTAAALLLSVAAVLAPPAQLRSSAALATIQDINPNTSTNSDADAATGGRVNHLASVAGNNQVFYAASEQGGLFKTTNNASSWTHLDNHLPQITWDVKVDPGNTNRVYATSFYDGRVNPLSGIEVSTDAGATWTRPASATPGTTFNCSATAKAEPSAFGIGIRPDASQNVFVGTNCGVARSTDSGVTWTFLNPTPNVQATTVWAVLVESGGPTNQGIVNICGNAGFFRSTDAGANWTAGSGLPAGTCSLAASPDENYVLFAAASDNNIYESDNNGANWRNLGTPEPNPQGRIPFVVTNKRSSNFDLWFGDIGLFRAGCTTPSPPAVGGNQRCPTAPGGYTGSLTRNSGAHDDVGDLVFDPTVSTNSCPRLFSSDGGAHVNTNTSSPGCQGPSWQRSNVGLHALWTWSLSASAGASNLNLMLAAQDTGLQATTSGRNTPPSWTNPDCCDIFDASSDPSRSLTIECCFTKAPATRLLLGNADGSGLAAVNTAPPGNLPGFRPSSRLVRFADKKYAVVTGSGLFFTNDITANPIVWTQLGAASSPANACGVQVAVSSGTPTFLLQAGNCRANSGDQLFTFTGTGAGTWQRIDNKGGLSGGFGIASINPADPNRLYASNFALTGLQMVFSNDGGTTWNRDSVLDNLMTGSGVFRMTNQTGPTDFTGFNGYAQPVLVAFDAQDANLVVAGGHDSGVFLSADRGNSWGLMTDPFTPGSSGVPHLPQPRHAVFDHPAGQPTAIYIGSQGRGVWRLTAKATTLTYNGDLTADFDDPASLAATLLDASVSPAAPITNANVSFRLGSQTCSGTTNLAGRAQCTITINQMPGPSTVTASFAGDGQHLASSTSKAFTITREEAALTYTGDTSVDFHDLAHLSAVLLDPGDSPAKPIPGKMVTLAFGSQNCAGTTDATGRAACTLTITQTPGGPCQATASFAGDAFFLSASTATPCSITREETTLAYTGDTIIANGGTAHLAAVLKEDGIVPIAGRTVTLKLGTGAGAQTCTGVSDATGTARCNISPVAQPLGPGTIAGDFAGDAFYLPSSDAKATLLFAFLDRGSFVIGDLNVGVGKKVAFWGAQWSRLNSLSGGPAPNAFKGFAVATNDSPPTCNRTWDARPGNSGHPPSTVPSYMAVIVSSSIDKSGATITGNTPEIVVIKTNPGFGPSPGHPGTGTVVADPNNATKVAEVCHS